ncbi:hypothetical protein BTA51_17655 [Hahella sp. CCB-MM4]|uniref:acyltransferase family protein n=1 Tax=Hahella sp. (strain CCB-MM4) TaxID=1926491 RepID=UPI000B9BB684|nr:DUF5009 domain-containing protein [Hahella sp. CCB-MM4]OZG72174.1 hypothetical protein BTA51_17655 [Hahella sp. CCB-MM4]
MTTSNQSRNLSLDVLRGLTIALMILVNTPGSWSAVWGPLGHAHWHGYTPTDLVFPFFLFITGSAMYFSLRKFNYQPSKELHIKILSRVAIIFLIGLLLQWFPFTKSFDDLRIMGVLQRIALAYGIAAIAIIHLSTRWLGIFSGLILLGYWALLFFAGSAGDPYSIEHNIVRQVDLAVLGKSHIYPYMKPIFEPEGLLSTLPAVVNVIAGFWVTKAVNMMKDDQERFRKLISWGIALLVIGHVWGLVFPINKSLWTSSYVVVTSGWALVVLGMLVAVCATQRGKSVMEPFRIYGTNPLFIYTISWLWVSIYRLIPVPMSGSTVGLNTFMYESWFLPAADNIYLASHSYALVHVILFWVIAWMLDRQKIYIKI